MRQKWSIDKIKQYIKNNNIEVELLSTEYINNRTPLKFKCNCGNSFEKSLDNLLIRGHWCCQKCGKKEGWQNNRRDIKYSEFLLQIENAFKEHELNIIQNLNNDIIKTTKILCEDKNGNRGYISYENVLLNKHFSVFSKRFNKENLFYNLQNFSKNSETGVSVLEILPYDINIRTTEIKIKCKCSCGNVYVTNIGDFTTQDRCYCKECTKSESILERKVKNEILKYTKNIIGQKIFKDCRNFNTNYPLRFDFYIPQLNTCIEVDGEQHFKPVNFGNFNNNEEAIKNFERNKKYDAIKNNYCEKNNIKLIRINYKQIKAQEYKQIIFKLFNQL